MIIGKEKRGTWGTWEELILAGAVLRHGTQSWGPVSSELRARTLFPFSFTPEACEAKYKFLRQKYCGCKALFEDLKKRRVEELRKELEKYDDSIGSLETKLEYLKTDKETHSQIDSPTPPVLKLEDTDSLGKDSTKDGLSAGSFTQDILNITKAEISGVSDREKKMSCKRGSEIINGKEASNGDSANVGSANVSTSSRRSTGLNNLNLASPGIGTDHLMSVFNSIAENEVALVFRRKLDSQKRARYRKMVRRHVDFDTLRSKIENCDISSIKELFRDLLLLTSNALIFYSKRTREYKSAFLLREIVTKSYKKHCKGTSIRVSSSFCPLPEFCNLPVKPRSVRPHSHKFKLSTIVPIDDSDNSKNGALKRCEKPSSDDKNLSVKMQFSKSASNICLKPSNEVLVMGKKGVKRAGKVGGGSVSGKAKAVTTQNKKTRRK